VQMREVGTPGVDRVLSAITVLGWLRFYRC
jgi:hypothetical protein